MTEKKDITGFINEYMVALQDDNIQRAEQLAQEGEELTASYTDVTKAITTLTLGVNSQVIDVEENNQLNLNILIDALYKAEMINEDVLNYIEEAVEKTKEEEKGDKE